MCTDLFFVFHSSTKPEHRPCTPTETGEPGKDNALFKLYFSVLPSYPNLLLQFCPTESNPSYENPGTGTASSFCNQTHLHLHSEPSISQMKLRSSDAQTELWSRGSDPSEPFWIKESHFWWATRLDFMPGVHRLVACSEEQLRGASWRCFTSQAATVQNWHLISLDWLVQSWLEEVEVDDPLRWPLKEAAGRWRSTFNLNIVTFLCEKQKPVTDFHDFVLLVLTSKTWSSSASKSDLSVRLAETVRLDLIGLTLRF